MLLERLGKFCFTQMRPLLFFSLLSLPIVLSTVYLISQQLQLQELENNFLSTAERGKMAIRKKKKKEDFLKNYSFADPYFINQQIESLTFLNKEKEELKALLEHPATQNKKAFQERLAFLCSEKNHLTFAEDNIRSSSKIKETDEKQRHPIQVDEQDLQKLFSLIEDPSSSSFTSPQLIIRNFQLKKRETSLHNEVFEVEMELLKREWIQ